MAKKIKHGKQFEEDFIKSVPERCDVTRLKDAGGWSNATNMRFTSSNPCDFIVFSNWQGKDMYKLELKSVKGKSLPFSNIKDHQLKSLLESHSKSVKAYFVINFRPVNETYFVTPICMAEAMKAGIRASFSLQNARDNGILIKQTLIKVRYKYDLEWL